MIEINKQYNNSDSTSNVVLAGSEVCLLPATLLRTYAEQISQKLATHPSTMIQYSPEFLINAMLSYKSVVAFNGETDQLVGFGQLWKYEEKVLEFGSWLALVKGVGKDIIVAGSKLSQKIEPNNNVIAIVEHSNKIPQICIERLGGKYLRTKTSPRVYNRNSLQPAIMKIYDISPNKLTGKIGERE